MEQRPTRKHAVIGLVAVAGLILLTLLNRWEPAAESWNYWLFARVLREDGLAFSTKSPLYTVYLLLFNWLPFPTSVIAEYVVSISACFVTWVLFFRPTLGWGLSVFSFVIWLPFLQELEPPVQRLAIALSFAAMILRRDDLPYFRSARFRFALSYALFLCAAHMRVTYVLLPLAFLIVDAKKLRGLRPSFRDYPVVIVIAISALFYANQSAHPWNNAWGSTTTWQPVPGKSIVQAAFIQNVGRTYIRTVHGIHSGKDPYFTHKEGFGDATSPIGAFIANPRIVSIFLWENFKNLTQSAVTYTQLGRIYYRLHLGWPVHLLIWGFILWLAYRAVRSQRELRVFVLINILMVFAVIPGHAAQRVIPPMAVIVVFSAVGFASLLRTRVERGLPKVLQRAVLPLCLLVFSSGMSFWWHVAQSVVLDFRQGQFLVMRNTDWGIVPHWSRMQTDLQGCAGIVAWEQPFFAAFADRGIERSFDYFEIPPFGRLHDSPYDGLRPDRINCVFVTPGVTGDHIEIAGDLNMKFRMDNYVWPYIAEMKHNGAKTISYPGYGELIKLELNR
jgi:hypothetical protein